MAVSMSMPAAPCPETPHAGLMDQVYRYQRYVYDCTRKYYLFGRDGLIQGLDLKPGQSLVEIGCGTGRNLIVLARRYPGVRLYGLDASAQMLETARQQIARAGLSDRVIVMQGLGENLSAQLFGQGSFDHALFSYSLSMIPDWRRALFAAAAGLSPAGFVHIVDFGDFKNLPGRGLLRAWLRAFHVCPRAELLERLEQEFCNVGRALTLLPGRYAFRFSGPKGKMGPLCVAAESRVWVKH